MLCRDAPPATIPEPEASARLAHWALANGWAAGSCGDASQGWEWFRPSGAGGEPLLVSRAFRGLTWRGTCGTEWPSICGFFGRALEEEAVWEPVWAYARQLSPEGTFSGNQMLDESPGRAAASWTRARAHSLGISGLRNAQAIPSRPSETD